MAIRARPAAPSAPSAQVEQQAIQSLLGLYREAVLAEDIDRLQALLAPASALARRQTRAQCARTDGIFPDLAAFRQALSDTFRTQRDGAGPPPRWCWHPTWAASPFWKSRDPGPGDAGAAHPPVRTTWQLQRTTSGEMVTFGIGAVQRAAPWCRSPRPARCRPGR